MVSRQSLQYSSHGTFGGIFKTYSGTLQTASEKTDVPICYYLGHSSHERVGDFLHRAPVDRFVDLQIDFRGASSSTDLNVRAGEPFPQLVERAA